MARAAAHTAAGGHIGGYRSFSSALDLAAQHKVFPLRPQSLRPCVALTLKSQAALLKTAAAGGIILSASLAQALQAVRGM